MERESVTVKENNKIDLVINFIVENKFSLIMLLTSVLMFVLTLVFQPINSFYVITIFTLFSITFLSIKYSTLFNSLLLVYLGELIPNLILLFAPKFYLESLDKGNSGFLFIISTMFIMMGLLFFILDIIKLARDKKEGDNHKDLIKNIVFIIIGILYIALFNYIFTFNISGDDGLTTPLTPTVFKNSKYWIEIVAIILYFNVYWLLIEVFKKNENIEVFISDND